MPHLGKRIARNIINDVSYNVIDCIACGYAHLWPLPQASEIDAYYQSDAFYNTYSPSDWLRREAEEYQIGLWNARYAWELKHFGDDYAPIIDFGSGAGWFGDYAMQHGYPVIDIEPSPNARNNNARATYKFATLADADRQLLAGSHVRACLVMEHLLDPVGFLKRCRTLVGRGCLLEIIVPNEFNGLQQRVRKLRNEQFRYDDWFVQQPHINYFSKSALHKLLTRNGWRIKAVGATYPTEWWYLTGKQYIGNDDLGHELHIKRLLDETKHGEVIYNWYALLYKLFGYGREQIIFAERV
jgi:hypothetical protein